MLHFLSINVQPQNLAVSIHLFATFKQSIDLGSFHQFHNKAHVPSRRRRQLPFFCICHRKGQLISEGSSIPSCRPKFSLKPVIPLSRAYFQTRISSPFFFKIPNSCLQIKANPASRNRLGTLTSVDHLRQAFSLL